MLLDISQLPDTVSLTVKKGDLVELFERIATQKNELVQKTQAISKKPMSIDDLAAYIDTAKQTIYSWTSKGKIPHHKTPDGRKVFFIQSEIDQWLTSNRRDTTTEIQAQAAKHIEEQKKKRKR